MTTEAEPFRVEVAPTTGRIVISFSELDTFKQCPHKHQLAYRERWSRDRDETTAAGRGTLWHWIMDTHYTHLKEHPGTTPRPKVDALFAQLRAEGKDPDVLDLLMWMYEGYVEKWGLDEQWEVLAVEHRVVVPFRTSGGRATKFDLKMVIDLIVKDRDHGRIVLVDHKSHAYLPKDKELELDDQFGLYNWGLRQLGVNVFASVYNTARTQRNKTKPQTLEDRFSRFLMPRTEQELATLAAEALATARSMYSKQNAGERHTNTDTCKWRCDYTEACLLGRKTSPRRERQVLADLGFRQNFARH